MRDIPSRRALLRATGLAAMAVPAGAMAPRSFAPADPLATPPICRVADAAPAVAAAPGPRRSLKLTWNANAICTVGVPVAATQGIFERHNLDVELINFGGSTDQLLEAIATGKADAGVGMALRWLKPLEQGFDVKITTAIHGGCMRLFALPDSGIAKLSNLKGKTLGASDMAAPDKNFFSIVAAKQGLDPERDLTWRQFPADLLSEALKRGDIQGFALGDPLASLIRDRDGLVEVANNLEGEYAHRSCCILGLRGSLIRQDRAAARAITAALLEAQDWVHARPDEAAAIFAPYAKAPVPALAAMLRSHTHGHHPVGSALRLELAAYIEELKLVRVMRPNTDPLRLSERIFADVLTGVPA
ncbi:ABC transporter substrate-binding protein [Paracraurococcus lichenis]|uniref:ABC transporter substrate-binding protein n=1 Tax=Paracraurococcus lichenis TaxID=3064888 RepID=A0ABT9EB65_9PROT|nr:ABC transporter substrate-binding protein [Paracraurococcus sp. LOR1-02]MDO9713416.1 ABC transporter substrate-binding protein [Paracraurococcus sp. LOR1-02]